MRNLSNKSFSLIEIIVALGFSAVILTSFIALSAWSLNKAKDNETEDVAYQAMIQFNDLLRGSTNNVSVGELGDAGNFSSVAPVVNPRMYYMNNGYLVSAANAEKLKCNLKYASSLPNAPVSISVSKSDLFAFCRDSEGLQIKSSDGSNDSGICVFAEIKKLNSIANDYKYTYTIRALAEKSDGQIFDETIEGLRSAPFIPAEDADHGECN